jgi:cytosine deaminase
LITTNAAKALGIQDYGLAEGKVADLVVLDAEDVWDALWRHTAPVYVFRKGKDITLR